MAAMFDKLIKFFEVEFGEGGSVVLGFKPKELSRDDIIKLLGSVNMRHSQNLQDEKVNPIEYIKTNLHKRYESNPVIKFSEHMDVYNLVFRMYDCDPGVYDWPLSLVRERARLPPDPVETIMNSHWANPRAVLRWWKGGEMSKEQYTRGFKLDTLATVRDYFVNEDPWILETAIDREEVKALFGVLYKMGYVVMVRGYFIPKAKPKKEWLKWKPALTPKTSKVILDWPPSFAIIRMVQDVEEVQKTEIAEIEPGMIQTSLVLGMDEWACRKYKKRLVRIENVGSLKGTKQSIKRIVFLFGDRQGLIGGKHLPHLIYKGVSRLEGLCHAIKVLVGKEVEFKASVI